MPARGSPSRRRSSTFRRTRRRRSSASSSTPPWRRRGVARALLDGALASFSARGIRVVDAFPWKAGDSTAPTDHYHGPLSLFVAAGFTEIRGDEKDLTVVRKRLAPVAGVRPPPSIIRGGPLMPAHPAAARSLLPHYLALLYGLAIVYASLQPFANWIAPLPGTRSSCSRRGRRGGPASTSSPTPSPTCRSAFSWRWSPRRQTPLARLAAAVGHRRRAVVCDGDDPDVPAAARREHARSHRQHRRNGRRRGRRDRHRALGAHARAVAGFREHWFLPGKVGDLGLALLVIWLAVQVNPGIPLFATTFDPEFRSIRRSRPCRAAASPDLVAMLVAGATSAFQLLGVGLFLALLLRQRRYVGGAVLILIGTALLVKGIAAAVLLKPAVWEHWLAPGVSDGVAAGALLLLVAIWLPRPVQVALAAVALLSSVLAPLLTPDVLFARAPLSVFNWSYGQLLNFNGLTHAVLLVWPFAASAFLFALAGRPGWGEPE